MILGFAAGGRRIIKHFERFDFFADFDTIWLGDYKTFPYLCGIFEEKGDCSRLALTTGSRLW